MNPMHLSILGMGILKSMMASSIGMRLPAYLQYARIIQKLGFSATFKEFKIQNIVGSCAVPFAIRLEGMAFSHKTFANVSRLPT